MSFDKDERLVLDISKRQHQPFNQEVLLRSLAEACQTYGLIIKTLMDDNTLLKASHVALLEEIEHIKSTVCSYTGQPTLFDDVPSPEEVINNNNKEQKT